MVFIFQSYGYGKYDDDKQKAFDLVWYAYLNQLNDGMAQ
jgi:hypothetical protein